MNYIRFILLVILTIKLVSAQSAWREDSFEDFIDGRFDDAGANMYVSHNGSIQTSNRWDVNGDGHVDILCVNSHPLVEMLDMSIYWGNGKDFSIKNHSYVPANGPMWITPGDLDEDGDTDLVVANYSNGTWTEMDSYVYYSGSNETGLNVISIKRMMPFRYLISGGISFRNLVPSIFYSPLKHLEKSIP